MTKGSAATRRPRPTLPDRVRDLLLADLFASVYVAGDRLPNEDELATRFDVSRETIREAVRGLVEAGYLVRRHGTGTFVTALPRHRHTLNANLSYTAMIRQAGLEPGRKLIRRLVRAATGDEINALAITAADTVLFVERIRTADGRPVVYSTDRISEVLLGAAVEGVVDSSSLYALLEEAHAGVRSALATLHPVVADARLVRLLHVRAGAPLQEIEQVDFDELGLPVMFSSEWHVPDIFELSVNRMNDAPAGGVSA